ncbi:MAG TPA: integrase core domain-containing protein [Verrucomicrobiae bacterium]|nr:integrase core domain-containing protein [Verrucomicrobiae bacterium]
MELGFYALISGEEKNVHAEKPRRTKSLPIHRLPQARMSFLILRDFWISQQLREAFPYDQRHRYLVHDRDAKFGDAVNETIAAIGLMSTKTSLRSPWQNGIAERWVASCRRDFLDHIIPLNEKHLKRLVAEYVHYYHGDRTHLGLDKDTPDERPAAIPNQSSRVVSFPRLGGLHHRYDLAA